MKRCLPILLSLFSSLALSIDDNSRASCAEQIQHQVQITLEGHGICASSQDCSRKQIYFLSKGSNMFFQFYGISDRSVIKEIVSMASSKRFELENTCEKFNLTIEFYYKTRQELGYSSGLFRKPDLELHIEER